MAFDWGKVLLLWFVIGIPGCLVMCLLMIADEHPVLGMVFAVLGLLLMSLAVGLPTEVFGL